MPIPKLPVPEADARAHSERVAEAVRNAIESSGGWIPFEAYMQIVLYAPGLGYYVAGARKFGAAGDFVTAPEMTPLFARSLASQVGRVLAASDDAVLELGAGSGRLAADLMAALDRAGRPPRHYRILEVSPDLRERQRATIGESVPALADRVEWLDRLPDRIAGVVLMNEVLDAVPVRVVVRRAGEWMERGVALRQREFVLEDRPLADGLLLQRAAQRFPDSGDFASEINLAAESLIELLGRRLASGAILCIDYGFPRHEYYHPQRVTGTVMGHYRHRAHSDPFLWPGLSDLTAHVDFTAVADAGVKAGLHVAGFSTLAAFLLGSGILDELRTTGAPESLAYLREAAAVQKLLAPAEMGELFKVIALARSEDIEWPAFGLADMRRRL